MPTYLDLGRRFVHRRNYDHEEVLVAEVTDKRVNWPHVLKNRFAVVIAPANYGKTTEMVEQVKRMRQQNELAVFVALRKVADRGAFEKALEPTERAVYEAWRRAPTTSLTLFIDSLDEASAAQRDGIADLIADVAAEVRWPNDAVRWVISTRPAVLSASVRETIAARLVVPYATTAKAPLGQVAAAATGSSTTSAAGGESSDEAEALNLFSMLPLDSGQARAYLLGRHPALEAAEVFRIAHERGLAGFTKSPGGLDALANIGLTTSPPESLTEVFQRVLDAVQARQRNDERIATNGGARPGDLTEAVQKLASASQVCQLPAIELTDDVLSTTEGVLSARRIAGDSLPDRALRQLLNTETFIDAGLNQVKLYPDEIAPFLGAQRLASLVQSPQQARTLIEHFSWQAPTGEQGVYRQFLPLMGWLATLNVHCREELLEREPQALAFFGDLRNPKVPLAAARFALTESIRRLVDQGDRLGRGMFNLTSENFWQAGPARLAPLLKELFRQHRDHPWARNVLLDIVTAARSEVLRSLVLRQHRNSYTQLIKHTADLRYILELGYVHDLAGLAAALNSDDTISESVAATLMKRLAWNHLTAQEIAVLVDKQFERGRGGFSVAYAFDSGLLDDAADDKLYELCRALVMRLARLRQRRGRLSRIRSRSTDRYVELVAETLAALLRRTACYESRRVAVLCLVMNRVLLDGHLSISNSAGLRHAIQENAAVRFELLSLAVKRAGTDKEKLWRAAYGYESLCELVPADVEKLNSPELSEVVREHEEAVAAHRANRRPAAPTRDERLKVSASVRGELLANLDGLREGSWTSGLAWVANWLLQTNPSSRYGEVRFEVLEQEVGPDIAQAIRDGFRKVWRGRAPEFKEDEPRSTYHITAAGLQGLHLELADGRNLPRLNKNEVKRAIQYSAFEINGYPKWFWPLVEAHPDVAGRELAQMVKRANAGAVSMEHAQQVLTSIDEAPPSVQAKVAPLAWAFIARAAPSSDYVLERLLAVATEVSSVTPRAEFERAALSKMQSAFGGPPPTDGEQARAIQAQRRQSAIWAASWLSAYATAFCKAVEKWLKQAPGDARDFIFQLAAYLGTDNGARAFRLARTSDEGVKALAELYKWTSSVVQTDDDAEHPAGDAYSPSDRDHAERFRDALIPAIAAAKSQVAYEVLDKFRDASMGAKQSYIRSVQFEMREAQFARPPLSQLKYRDFERNLTADVTDTTSFAMRVESDLLAVRYDIEQGEYSLRRFFTDVVLKKRPRHSAEGDTEGLALEAHFQSLLANQLHHHSKGLYSVTVEPQTAESKRRDVLCSKGNMFVSIELKMSIRWTLDKYEEALEKQLVGQYMRHSRATTGFLVIVLQEKDRIWRDRETGEVLDFEGLLARLRALALRLEAKDRRRYLRVIGIDATKPLDFRAATKKSPKLAATKASKGNAAPAGRIGSAKETAGASIGVAAAAVKRKAKPHVPLAPRPTRKTLAARQASMPTSTVRQRGG